MGRRSAWKLPYVDSKLLKKVKDMKASGKSVPIKTWSRRSTIVEAFLNMTFLVHKGKDFEKVVINNENMFGFKLGAFAPTRKKVKHPEKKAVVAPAKKGGKK